MLTDEKGQESGREIAKLRENVCEVPCMQLEMAKMHESAMAQVHTAGPEEGHLLGKKVLATRGCGKGSTRKGALRQMDTPHQGMGSEETPADLRSSHKLLRKSQHWISATHKHSPERLKPSGCHHARKPLSLHPFPPQYHRGTEQGWRKGAADYIFQRCYNSISHSKCSSAVTRQEVFSFSVLSILGKPMMVLNRPADYGRSKAVLIWGAVS